MKPESVNADLAQKSSEQLLIERANLSRSAGTRRTQSAPNDRSSYDKSNTISENSLITHAILTTSGTTRDQHKSKSVGQTPGLSIFSDLDSVGTQDEVFVKEAKDTLEELSNRSTCWSDTEDNAKEQATLKPPQKTTANARTSNNSWQLSGNNNVTDGVISSQKSSLQERRIPLLVIEEADDRRDAVSQRSQDGYRVPRNSMADCLSSGMDVVGPMETVLTRETRPSDNYDLPTDVYFDELVHDIAREINIDDFELLQKVFMYREGVVDCLDVDQDSPITFFRKLQRWRLLSRDNVSLLQEVTQLLDKPHLHARAVQYVRHNWETVFFYQEMLLSLQGFDKVKLYKSSTDFTRFKRADLEAMRSALSAVLVLPQHSVYVVGIEPALAGGVVITWMLPEHLLEILEEQTAGGLPLLNQLGIYCLEISGTTFNIRGHYTGVSGQDTDHNKFLTVYRQLRENTAKLQERDLEVSMLKRETEFLRLELETMGTELQLLTERSAHDHLEYTKAVSKLRAVDEKARQSAASQPVLLPIAMSTPRVALQGKPSAVIEAVSRPLASRRSRSVERSTTQTLHMGSRDTGRTLTRHSFRSTVTKHTRQTEFLFDVGRKYKRLHGRDELFEEIEHIIHELGGISEPL